MIGRIDRHRRPRGRFSQLARDGLHRRTSGRKHRRQRHGRSGVAAGRGRWCDGWSVRHRTTGRQRDAVVSFWQSCVFEALGTTAKNTDFLKQLLSFRLAAFGGKTKKQ
jgi:hypothetical protein